MFSQSPAETDQPAVPATGRILALDLGEKRIGVAVSDESRTIARAERTLLRASRLADFEKIGAIVDEQGITLLVVGLPVPLSGIEGPRVAWVRDYAADLARRLGHPVILWDESFTTIEAQAALRAQGKRGRKSRQRVDAVAAAIILQSFLDAHHPRAVGSPPEPGVEECG
jgi:putative Holliday junction resolvase